MIIRNSRERETTERIELQKWERIRTLREKENYKYLGLLDEETIKQADMKEKVRKNNLRRTRKLLETMLYRRNLINR